MRDNLADVRHGPVPLAIPRHRRLWCISAGRRADLPCTLLGQPRGQRAPAQLRSLRGRRQRWGSCRRPAQRATGVSVLTRLNLRPALLPSNKDAQLLGALTWGCRRQWTAWTWATCPLQRGAARDWTGPRAGRGERPCPSQTASTNRVAMTRAACWTASGGSWARWPPSPRRARAPAATCSACSWPGATAAATARARRTRQPSPCTAVTPVRQDEDRQDVQRRAPTRTAQR